MTRLAATLILTFALAAPLGACAKKGSLDDPPDTVRYSYPAPAK